MLIHRVALLVTLAVVPLGQGTLTQDEGFHLLILAMEEPGGVCPTAIGTSSQKGTVDLTAAGVFRVAGSEYTVCSDGSAHTSTGSQMGPYTLDTSGRLFYDALPGMPGAEVFELRYRFDHGLMNLWGDNLATPNVDFALAFRRSTSRPVVSGTYFVVRQTTIAGGGAFQMRVESGTIVFDGAGGWSESGLRHTVTSSGSSNVGYSRSGTVAVTNNGILVMSGIGFGAASADGELLMWDVEQPASTGMAIAVRAGAGHSLADLDGGWELADIAFEPLPRGTERATSASVNGATGSWSRSGVRAVQTGAGATRSPFSSSGTASVTPSGLLTVNDSASSAPLLGGLSESGRYFVLASVFEPGVAELRFGFKDCVAPVAYGTGTAGTLGAPFLAATGGAPVLGNAAFGYLVANARPSGSGLLLVASAPLPGVPLLGGRLWINPGSLFSSRAFSTDFGGVAALPTPLPGSASLVGTDLHAQAFVFDSAAPGGVAMSRGLAFELCE